MKEFDPEARIKQAVENFESGYNCAQAIFLAYCDLFDIDQKTGSMMSVSFGGGLGRMREVCGTVSAMAMLAGFKYPVPDTTDLNARTRNYAMVQKMADLFKEKHETIICKNILKRKPEVNKATPEARTPAYYSSRPCTRLVADAADITNKMLSGELD
ncbi:C_GCAxxG_C_C family protein [Parabacteroides sp. 52]|uniref:C-GCAxxG-C-C family protein n=1 Tax=unclassified Parabacteroides TaxID=2649774 RepID=UPI0013D76C64|nr:MULTISPECIES: C-GCAxxG-C-C family protein [unclassified Parabacteroides]MDH6533473.1 C_GCAxxG_C_C family probable redox protein [Parabacteroides sp. PM5-20]NDV54229.1 C_GCAxxG_C_C family protein [Parabacteroides sp. 52]